MPGKLCIGKPLFQPHINESKAYCEGRDAAAEGQLQSTNPIDENADPIGHELWDAGHISWTADPAGQQQPVDCCARPYGGGYVPP